MRRPRAFVLLVLVLLAPALTGACGATSSKGSVTLLGTETAQFRELRRAFEAKTGIEVRYRATRAQDQVLLADVQNGTPPDVAALSGPGEVASYELQGRLKPLDGVVDEAVWRHYSAQWRTLAQAGLDRLYAVPVEVNLKSIVWFNADRRPAQTPRTLPELVALRPPVGGGATWCMGMGSGAASGWPGTDWIEDVLLQRSGVEVYQRWVAGALPWDSPRVRAAWETWGRIATGAGQVHGGATAALLTSFVDAGRPMFTDPPRCSLEHQGSFMPGFYRSYQGGPQPKTFDFFEFPGLDATPPDAVGRSREVAADMVVMFNDTPQARELVRFLVSDEAQRLLPAEDSFSADVQVLPAAHPDAVDQRIARTLVGGDTLCLDASDMMPATMRNAFYRAVLEYLSDPGQLGALLADLDKTRERLPRERWLTVSCGKKR
jgi:alpha-glucoside transport system substrate-binding protein